MNIAISNIPFIND